MKKRKFDIGEIVDLEVLGLGKLKGRIIGYELAKNLLPVSSKHGWYRKEIHTSPRQKKTNVTEEDWLYYVMTTIGHDEEEILVTEECIRELEDEKG